MVWFYIHLKHYVSFWNLTMINIRSMMYQIFFYKVSVYLKKMILEMRGQLIILKNFISILFWNLAIIHGGPQLLWNKVNKGFWNILFQTWTLILTFFASNFLNSQLLCFMGKNNQNHGGSRQQRSIFIFYASLLEERPAFGLCRGTQFRSIFEPTF